MYAKLFALSAAACLFAGSSAGAAPDELHQYAARANARAEALLSAAGIDPKTETVAIAAHISSEGRVIGVDVVRSSGSPDTDRTVEKVLRRVVREEAPLGLVDGSVILNLGDALMQTAANR